MSETQSQLVADVEKLAHTQVNDCYQCGKCTAGCPRGDVMDIGPTRLIRLVQTGEVLEAARAAEAGRLPIQTRLNEIR